MKKIYFLLLTIVLLLTSCNKGAINGYVTYQLSEFATPAIDQYAEIYITKDNVDTINLFLEIIELKENIHSYQQTIKRTNNQQIIDSLQKEISKKELLLNNKTPNERIFNLLSNRAMQNLIDIEDNKRNLKKIVDNEGLYSTTIKAGNYNIVAISETIKKNNFLERHGKIVIKQVTVNNKEQEKVNINFK